jgi:hypothetical protein
MGRGEKEKEKAEVVLVLSVVGAVMFSVKSRAKSIIKSYCYTTNTKEKRRASISVHGQVAVVVVQLGQPFGPVLCFVLWMVVDPAIIDINIPSHLGGNRG